MNQVLPYALWLGHAGDGRDFRQVLDAGIEALVQLAVEEPPLQPPRELIYCRFPLLDGSENRGEVVSAAIRTTATLLEMKIPTLLCCGAGMSRSPAIAAAALAFLNEESPEACLRQVTAQHPSDVSPGLWQEIKAILSEGGGQ